MSDAVIPTRYRLRVKQRLVVLAYAEEHGLKPAARHFAPSRTSTTRTVVSALGEPLRTNSARLTLR